VIFQYQLNQLNKEIYALYTEHNDTYYHRTPTRNTIRTSDIISKSLQRSARVTAFSAVEYCRTSFAKKIHPNCNGQTYPDHSVAIKKAWLKQGITSVAIPALSPTPYRVIGTTDDHTDVDVWTGKSQAAAFQIANKIRTIELIRE
jgi:hypothetical protein